MDKHDINYTKSIPLTDIQLTIIFSSLIDTIEKLEAIKNKYNIDNTDIIRDTKQLAHYIKECNFNNQEFIQSTLFNEYFK